MSVWLRLVSGGLKNTQYGNKIWIKKHCCHQWGFVMLLNKWEGDGDRFSNRCLPNVPHKERGGDGVSNLRKKKEEQIPKGEGGGFQIGSYLNSNVCLVVVLVHGCLEGPPENEDAEEPLLKTSAALQSANNSCNFLLFLGLLRNWRFKSPHLPHHFS